MQYLRDSLSYLFKIKLWCREDFWLNVCSHRYIYKYGTAEIGKAMYQLFLEEVILDEQEFLKGLEKLRDNQNVR